MIKKIGGFLEEHIEKIILIIVGLLCSWLLFTRVLLTPNIVEHKGEKYSSGNIDEKIRQKLNEKENEKDYSLIDIELPEDRNYTELLQNPLGDINPVFLLKPGLPKDTKESIYDEPDIGKIKVANVDIEHIRSVVYEPVIEVTRDRPYDESDCEPNDLDFITVSGYIDILEIVEEFERCYPDPCMAKPIFASVNLQRQRKNSDGQWSDWINVPRTKIDYNRNLFKVVETFSDLPLGGLKIYKYQLNNIMTQLELLQPEPYQIASAGEEWLTPMLHRELISAKKKDEREAKRLEAAEQSTTTSATGGRRGRERNTAGTGGIGSTSTGTTRRRGGTTTGTTSRGSRGRGGNTDTRINQRLTNDPLSQDELNVNQVYDDFESIILTDDTDLTEISEPILFWAHDDTVEPDNTYRYRIRVGLLNPAAEEERDKIIFWTDFSEETDEVDVPGKMYFFAMGDVQETAKTVSVSVYKLALGYWYKKVFDRVAQGEMIGDIVENERKDSDTTDDNGDTTSSEDEEPETIDFTTGAVMVDVVRASTWTGGNSTNPLPYYDMLYSYDGIDIRHMPVTRTANPKIWPPDLYDDYRYVQEHINKKREPFQAWGASEIDISQVRGGLQSGIGIRRLR